MECVERLANLLGVSGRQGDRFDWAAVEKSVGVSLPGEYKKLVETFPHGRFQGFLELVRPEINDEGSLEYLGYFAYRLDDMRRWREDEPERFPLPIFPEPGGLLPWARTRCHGLFCWLTEGDEPGAWPTVVTDAEFSCWEQVDRSMCGLVTDIALGRFDTSRFDVDLIAKPPWLEPIPPLETAGEPLPREMFW